MGVASLLSPKARHVRADSKEPGIGLRLATVKRLAEAHGGGVGVDSSPGSGCTFWFELPKALAQVVGESILLARALNGRVES